VTAAAALARIGDGVRSAIARAGHEMYRRKD